VRERLIYTSVQFVQPSLEDAALGLRIGCELGKTPAQIGFCRGKPRLERTHELLALPLECCLRLAEPALEALCGRFADVREPFAEDAFRLVGECRNGAVELA
jgi:hypothetical protein